MSASRHILTKRGMRLKVIPSGLQRLAANALTELDRIAYKYMKCEKFVKRLKLKKEFRKTAIQFNRRIKQQYPNVNVSIFTFVIERYIRVRNSDGWKTS